MANEYHVIELFIKPKGSQELEDWLNERFKEGDVLIGVYEGMFIFKRNINLSIIMKTDRMVEEAKEAIIEDVKKEVAKELSRAIRP